MKLISDIPYDYLSASFFSELLHEEHYQANSSDVLHLNSEFYSFIAYYFKERSVLDFSKNFYLYDEYSSGHSGKAKTCTRPSISQHLEMRRLKQMLDFLFANYTSGFCDEIYYYSRYGRTVYEYIDHSNTKLSLKKYTEHNVEKLYKDLRTVNDNSFILSGSPSSIADLYLFEFMNFRPAITLLSGEKCPLDLKTKIARHSDFVVNMYVMREFGLLGFECPKQCEGKIHLFSNHFEFNLNDANALLVTDPSNYILKYRKYNTGDVVESINFEHCKCGVSSTTIRGFSGRNYNKPYPAL